VQRSIAERDRGQPVQNRLYAAALKTRLSRRRHSVQSISSRPVLVRRAEGPSERVQAALRQLYFRSTRSAESAVGASLGPGATRLRKRPQSNADTQQNITQYFDTVPAADLDVVLEAQAACLHGIDDSEQEWSQERGAIEQEVVRDLSNPTYKFIDPKAGKILEHLILG
jgi:hypothetical protein